MFHCCFAGLSSDKRMISDARAPHDPPPRTDINEGEKLGATKHRRDREKKWGGILEGKTAWWFIFQNLRDLQPTFRGSN